MIGTVAVVFLRYSNIGSLFSSSQNFSLEENSEHGETVGSSVIAVAIHSTPPMLYPVEKITLTLKHAQVGFLSNDHLIKSKPTIML